MPVSPPLLDARSYEELVAQTEKYAEALSDWRSPASRKLVAQKEEYARALPPWPPAASEKLDPGSALIHVFARMMSQLLERLNKLPEKHQLAFLDLLGAQRLPPLPARAPLTFHLAEGTAAEESVKVPAGVQVAAAGGAEPIVFETEEELTLTSARLVWLFVREPARSPPQSSDPPASCSDRSPVPGLEPEPFLAFSGAAPHALLVACDGLFSRAGVTRRWLSMPNGGADLRRWFRWEESGWSAKSLAVEVNQEIRVEVPELARSTINGITAGWLLCLPSTAQSAATRLSKLEAGVDIHRQDLAPDLAFFNGLPLDLSKDFYPFGERPRFNDTFLLASAEALQPGAKVTLQVTPSVGRTAAGSDDLKLTWELWGGGGWIELGSSTPKESKDNGHAFRDTTLAFTSKYVSNEQGAGNWTITFEVPAQGAELPLNGVSSRWLRVRLIAGNYGEDARVTVGDDGKPVLKAATLQPPSIQSLALAYDVTVTRPPELGLRQDDRSYEDWTAALQPGGFPAGGLAPFVSGPDEKPTLYLGFDTPFANRPTTLYVHVEPPLPKDVTPRDPPAAPPVQAPRLAWEYRTKDGWAPLHVEDGTRTFSRSGLVRFVGPVDLARGLEFGRDGFWLRIRWDAGDFPFPVRLRHVLTNTVWASHSTTATAEVLGSSDEGPDQVFSTARAPVLRDPRLEVREPAVPAPADRDAIEAQEGSDAISVVPGGPGEAPAVWVRWHAVPDFHASGPGDRHYVLDHETGRIHFGDDRQGRIPPRGRDNLRMAWYRSGGGARGNVAAGQLTQLKTTLPYVDRVANPVATAGGADLEELERFKERTSLTLRHGGRAVTAQDLEDLAREASPAVARARALTPAFDPITQIDPEGHEGEVLRPGQVWLAIVPASDAPQPTPGADLLEQVKAHLSARCPPSLSLVVTGPRWAGVQVQVEVVPSSVEQAEEVGARVHQAICRFLHPLTGGPQGRGWDFGRWPHTSDLYAPLSSLEGVDHIPSVTLSHVPPPKPGEPVDHPHPLDPVTLLYALPENITVKIVTTERGQPPVPGRAARSSRRAKGGRR